jgi:hypothetical protein
MKKKEVQGCITALFFLVLLIIGIGYGTKFLILQFQFSIPENILRCGLVVGFLMLFFGNFLVKLWAVNVKNNKEKKEIVLSSSLLIDIMEWLGMIIILFSISGLLITKNATWIQLFIGGFLMIAGVFLFWNFKKNTDNRIVISDDYVSIDELNLLINKEDLGNIITYTENKGLYQSPDYMLIFIYKTKDDNKINYISINSIDKLNISRDVIVRYLNNKGYKIIDLGKGTFDNVIKRYEEFDAMNNLNSPIKK